MPINIFTIELSNKQGGMVMAFADTLQQLRKNKGLSQEDIAERCNVSRQSVSKWETGQGYPETEKLLTLCDLLDTDLDYLLRDKVKKINMEQISSASICTPYLRKWVKIFLNDREFQGLYCVAIVAEAKNFVLFIDDKGKRGLLNISAISSITDADKEKYTELPEIPTEDADLNLANYFADMKCNLKKRQQLFSVIKPISFCSVTVNEINTEKIVVHDKKSRICTVAATEVLYIKEQ